MDARRFSEDELREHLNENWGRDRRVHQESRSKLAHPPIRQSAIIATCRCHALAVMLTSKPLAPPLAPLDVREDFAGLGSSVLRIPQAA